MAEQPMETDQAAVPIKKKKPNRLLVEEANNDDNSVIALNNATMEELHGGTEARKCPPPTKLGLRRSCGLCGVCRLRAKFE